MSSVENRKIHIILMDLIDDERALVVYFLCEDFNVTWLVHPFNVIALIISLRTIIPLRKAPITTEPVHFLTQIIQ